MITKEVIEELYKKFKSRPESVDDLNMPPLFEAVHPSHGITISDGNLVIKSIPETSFFRTIPLKNIHAIVEFESTVAIVMHSSIIFLSKDDNKTNIHFKPLQTSVWDKFKSKLHKTKSPFA